MMPNAPAGMVLLTDLADRGTASWWQRRQRRGPVPRTILREKLTGATASALVPPGGLIDGRR